MGTGTVASIFSEPTSRTIAFATFIALFELVNITGQMDSVVSLINNANILPEFNILEGKEKLILIPTSLKTASLMYSDLPISLWADLKFHNQDYIIGAYLFYVLLRIWIHRPSKISTKRKKPKLITFKSRRWFFLSLLSLISSSLFITNKFGKLASLYSKTGFKTFPEGARLNSPWGDPRWIEPLPKISFFDFLEVFLVLLFVVFCLNKTFKITLPKRIREDNLTSIERVWKNTDDAISLGMDKSDKALPMVNKAFSELVDLLSASASMNIAATALEDGDVKTSFDRWSMLTAEKGREADKWIGLSNSLSDIGIFNEGDEEE